MLIQKLAIFTRTIVRPKPWPAHSPFYQPAYPATQNVPSLVASTTICSLFSDDSYSPTDPLRVEDLRQLPYQCRPCRRR